MKTQQLLTRPAVAMLITLFGVVASLSSPTAWAHGDSHKGLEDEWYMNIDSVEDLESDRHGSHKSSAANLKSHAVSKQAHKQERDINGAAQQAQETDSSDFVPSEEPQ